MRNYENSLLAFYNMVLYIQAVDLREILPRGSQVGLALLRTPFGFATKISEISLSQAK